MTSLVAQTVKHLSTVRETRFDPWVGKIPWRRKWQSTPGLLPGKSHGQRSLSMYATAHAVAESDTTERDPSFCVIGFLETLLFGIMLFNIDLNLRL